ncbi:MAG: YhcH/YjgK/YiaL family protein [Bacteroidota bacterium]
MKSGILKILLAHCMLGAVLFAQEQSTNEATMKKVDDWFNAKAWLGGVKLEPHKSINRPEFERQYQLNKPAWDSAFAFLRDRDLSALPKGKYPIDGDNVFASITEDSTKNFENTKWESHRNYVDLQYVIRGEEKIGVCTIAKATVTKLYDGKSDAANYAAEGTYYRAVPDTFFLFFPSDVHRPGVTPGGNKIVKKLVIKVRVATKAG